MTPHLPHTHEKKNKKLKNFLYFCTFLLKLKIMEEFNVKETPEIVCEKCGGRIYRSFEVLPVAHPWYFYYCNDCGYAYYSHVKDETIKESFEEIQSVVNTCVEFTNNSNQNYTDTFVYCAHRLFELLNENNDSNHEREILLLIRKCFKNIPDTFTEDVCGSAHAIM